MGTLEQIFVTSHLTNILIRTVEEGTIPAASISLSLVTNLAFLS